MRFECQTRSTLTRGVSLDVTSRSLRSPALSHTFLLSPGVSVALLPGRIRCWPGSRHSGLIVYGRIASRRPIRNGLWRIRGAEVGGIRRPVGGGRRHASVAATWAPTIIWVDAHPVREPLLSPGSRCFADADPGSRAAVARTRPPGNGPDRFAELPGRDHPGALPRTLEDDRVTGRDPRRTRG